MIDTYPIPKWIKKQKINSKSNLFMTSIPCCYKENWV